LLYGHARGAGARLEEQVFPLNPDLARFVDRPTGSAARPLADTEYITEPSLESTLLPARFSGRSSCSLTVRLSSSTIISTGGETVVVPVAVACGIWA